MDLFGTARLGRALVARGTAGPEACIARLRSEVGAFSRNTPPADDQTVIAIRCV